MYLQKLKKMSFSNLQLRFIEKLRKYGKRYKKASLHGYNFRNLTVKF